MHVGVFSALPGALIVPFSSLVTGVNARPTQRELRAALLVEAQNHASYPPHDTRITLEAYVTVVTNELLSWGAEFGEEVAKKGQCLGGGNTFVYAAPAAATSRVDATHQPEILREKYSCVGGAFAVSVHKGLEHARNAHKDGGEDAQRARGSGDTELSTSVWSDGGVPGDKRRRSRRLIVADQKRAETEFEGLAKDDIYGVCAAAGVAATVDKNGEDPGFYTRLGYDGDGDENDAEQHHGRTLGSAKQGALRARTQTSSVAADLAKAEEAAVKSSLANITSRRHTLKKVSVELAEEKKAKKAAGALASSSVKSAAAAKAHLDTSLAVNKQLTIQRTASGSLLVEAARRLERSKLAHESGLTAQRPAGAATAAEVERGQCEYRKEVTNELAVTNRLAL